jgi:hypothetical protein
VEAEIIATIATALGMTAALWMIMSNFDRRNEGRFNALRRKIQAMGAELKLENRQSADRRVVQK